MPEIIRQWGPLAVLAVVMLTVVLRVMYPAKGRQRRNRDDDGGGGDGGGGAEWFSTGEGGGTHHHGGDQGGFDGGHGH